MERLARAVKLAAKYREESYDKEAADKAEKVEFHYVDMDKFYKLSLREACDKAAEEVGFDKRGTEPVYLLLTYCWNDILDWAELFESGTGSAPPGPPTPPEVKGHHPVA